ncbi:TetR family transcriptional regulator [Solirubrobacter phytolaccae]|uniref:TetR family transcriptional regulator n=1 Tax=Solirubrobacter phytolaccae TaxID=1404360 RepID=A0A9X3S8L8_9ACTN|nr:TetR family transcriptional regulator [Solirubrobacter phytolaccae]MDA0182359.1 TetR family transcriptional regulator [Solirubrobacter phytolaccae]
MARWEPNASGRLREAAMALYTERGYEQTTVGDIAERAGLTARTFFRYFADKREVLFAGSEALEGALRSAVDEAPEDASPMQVVAAVLDGIAALIGRDRDYSRQRQVVIDATPELQERELIKLARLALVLRDALRARGVSDPEAGLAAETALAIVRVGFDRWINTDDERELADVLRESLARLETLVAP